MGKSGEDSFVLFDFVLWSRANEKILCVANLTCTHSIFIIINVICNLFRVAYNE